MYREAESMGRRSNPRLLLLLLRTGQNRNHRQRGFSLAMVLMALMVAIVSAGTLAMRSASSHSGSMHMSAGRQAREAAENGVTEIVAELNRPQNRRLLVSGTSPDSWGSATDITQRNPCENLNGSVVTPTASVGTAANNTWKPAGGNGQYVLRSVRYSNRDRDARVGFGYTTAGSGGAITRELFGDYDNNTPGAPNADVNLDPVDSKWVENFGLLRLEVQGRVLRPGSETDTLATATVVKEYEVIPKCCNRSFSGPSSDGTEDTPLGTPLYSFGNDQRACGGTANLGLLFGFNGGALTVNGTASSVQQLNFDPGDNKPLPTLANTSLKSALCITTTPTANNCVSPTSTNPIPVAGGSTVPVIPIIFDVDPPPTFGGGGNGGSGKKTGVITSSGYLRVKSDLSDIELCTPTGSGSTINIDPKSCEDVDYCERVAGSTVANYHCLMNRIRITGSNDVLYFDTSRGSIALFFDDEKTGNSNNNGTAYVEANSNLYHLYCSTPPADTRGCPTVAPASEFARLSFFGNQTYNDFTFLGEGETASIFIYFPKGNVQIGSKAAANGAIWTRNLTLNGSFTSAAPAANCATASSGFCYILRGSLGAGKGGGSAALFDWVARSPVTTRVY